MAYGDGYGSDYGGESVVPVPAGTPLTQAEKAEQGFYGADLLHAAGTFPLGPNGDYILDTGEEALRRAIHKRLGTNPGEYKFRPEYGVGAGRWARKAASASNLDNLKERIVAQVSQDPRVEKVVSVDVGAVTNNTLRIKITVKAHGRELRLAPFDVLGD